MDRQTRAHVKREELTDRTFRRNLVPWSDAEVSEGMRTRREHDGPRHDVRRTALVGLLVAEAPSLDEIADVAALVRDLGVVAHDAPGQGGAGGRAAMGPWRWHEVEGQKRTERAPTGVGERRRVGVKNYISASTLTWRGGEAEGARRQASGLGRK
jgi:hypothetical protein